MAETPPRRRRLEEPAQLADAKSDSLAAREGDVIVVSYPEVTVPLRTRYASVKVGGMIYTRRLLEGDDVGEQFDKVYAFLQARAESVGVEKIRLWGAELSPSSTKPDGNS